MLVKEAPGIYHGIQVNTNQAIENWVKVQFGDPNFIRKKKKRGGGILPAENF